MLLGLQPYGFELVCGLNSHETSSINVSREIHEINAVSWESHGSVGNFQGISGKVTKTPHGNSAESALHRRLADVSLQSPHGRIMEV